MLVFSVFNCTVFHGDYVISLQGSIKFPVLLYSCVCVSSLYKSTVLTDLDKNWYEASLGAGAEQGQVADALGRTAQQPWNPKKQKCPYLGIRCTDLDQSWCVDAYTMFKHHSKN